MDSYFVALVHSSLEKYLDPIWLGYYLIQFIMVSDLVHLSFELSN